MLLVLIRSAVHVCIFFGLLMLVPIKTSHAQTPNSPKDPYLLKLKDRSFSETPIPCGFILGVRPALGGGTSLAYSADAYYDCWQIGYHNEDYGTTYRLTLRWMGRDTPGGIFFEYGSGTGKGDSTDLVGIPITSGTFPYTLYGGGIKYVLGFMGKGVTTGGGASIAFGAASSNAGSTIQASGTYLQVSAEYGVRIPISTMALTLEAYAFGYMVPGYKTTTGIESTDNSSGRGGGGIGLNVKYAFNFNG